MKARSPNSKNVKPQQHILGERETPYISTTKDYEIASPVYNRNRTPIVKIDLKKVTTEVIDFTNKDVIKFYLDNPKAIYNVLKDAEVLIKEKIVPEAIIKIIWPGT